MTSTTLVTIGPFYFAANDDGELLRTTPSEVGSTPATHTGFIFTTDQDYGWAPMSTMVVLIGEHGSAPEPAYTEAQFQLFGEAAE